MNITESIKKETKKIMKEIWETRIKEDLNNGDILYEASLVGRFFHHLSNELNGLYNEENIKMYLEYTLENKFTIDMVIVKLEDNWRELDNHLKESVKEILFVFEFKHSKSDKFKIDLNKIKGFNDNMEDYKKYKINKNTCFVNCFATDDFYEKNDETSFTEHFDKHEDYKNIDYMEFGAWRFDRWNYSTKVFDEFKK